MGIKEESKDWIWDNFRHCIQETAPLNTQLVSIDLMQYLKQPLPDTVQTKQDLVKYFVRCATHHFKSRIGCRVIVVNVDLESPQVKKIIEHPRRHKTRCDKCLPLRKQRSFHADCENRCEEKESLSPDDGPHLPTNMQDKLSNDILGKNWIRFARDSRNLRKELYPLLTNEFLNTVPPEIDQEIICNGFPVRTCKVGEDEIYDETGYAPQPGDSRVRVMQWLNEEIPIDLHDHFFEEVFAIRRMPPNPKRPQGWVLVTGRPEMKNKICEADNAVFFFARFFPQHNQMIVINDGDAIPIGLLRVAEDYRGDPNGPTHTTFVRFPCKLRDKAKIRRRFGDRKPPAFEYLNVTQLYAEISAFPYFQENGVQNPVAMVVALIIMNNTDFFKDFCPGLGFKREWSADEKKRASQTKGIWDTFWTNLDTYHHMFQWYTNDMHHDPTEKRRIVIDEELFVNFVYECYFNKFLHKNDTDKRNVKELQVRCSKRVPTRDQIMVWCRHLTWNLDYWLNACRDIDIDPYEQVNGQSYYGFHNGKVTASVYPDQKPVDRVFQRHFYANYEVMAPLQKKSKQ